jgi:hypothetical protein
MDDAARARILLEELHRAGYTVRGDAGELVITSDRAPVDQPLLDYVAPYRAHLLRMLEAADDVERIRRDSMKGT